MLLSNCFNRLTSNSHLTLLECCRLAGAAAQHAGAEIACSLKSKGEARTQIEGKNNAGCVKKKVALQGNLLKGKLERREMTFIISDPSTHSHDHRLTRF